MDIQRRSWCLLFLAWLALSASAQAAALKEALTDASPLTEGLLVEGIGNYGRRVVHTDALVYQLITHRFQSPQAGQTIVDAEGHVRTWQSLEADAEGWFAHEARGGYLYISVEASQARTALIHVLGPSMFYLNGQPRNGNRYAAKDTFASWQPNFNFVVLPIQLQAGSTLR